jgi:hypothetical protein
MLIIACGSEKINTTEPVQAKDLYVGVIFKAVWTKALTLDCDVRIMSAGYGLIKPETLILPYDRKMSHILATWYKENRPFEYEGAKHLMPEVYAGALPNVERILPRGLSLGRFLSAVNSIPNGDHFYTERTDGELATFIELGDLKQKRRGAGTLGICAYVKDCLLEQALDLSQLSAKLTERYGPPLGVSWLPTIRRQMRVQGERHNLTLVQNGNTYRFVPKV